MIKLVRLDELAKIQIGKTPKRAVNEYWGVGFPWVSIADMKTEVITQTKEQITELAIKDCGCKLIPKGSLIMSFKLSVGKLAFAGTNLFTNEAICAILIKEQMKIDPRYFYYALKNTKLTGSNMAVMGHTLNTDSLNSLKIPVIEKLSDQIRIAEILSQAESLIAQRKQSIGLLDELLKSTFLEMFGDPIKNPKNFPIRKLHEYYISPKEGTKCGPFGSALKKEEYKSEGVPVWIMDNISKSGEFISDGCLWIDESKYNELKSYNIINNDVIISRAGTVGKMCVVKTKYKSSIISTNLIRVRFGKDLLPLHFVSLMKYSVERIAKLRTGAEGSFTHMNTGILDGIIFPYPPLKLQKKFANIVEKVEALKGQYQQSLMELQNMYGVLSQKAFKGELKGNVELEMIHDKLGMAEGDANYKRKK